MPQNAAGGEVRAPSCHACENSAMSLDSEPPRDDQTVDSIAGAFIRRTNRFARNVALIFYALAVAMSLILAITMISVNEEAKVVATAIVCVLFFLGVLPGEFCRSAINKDARFARRLVREGVIHPASCKDIISPAQTVLMVAWKERDEEAHAKVTAPSTVRDLTGNVRVLIAPNLYVVGVLLGEDMLIGRRA
jgi:hypothetical protein